MVTGGPLKTIIVKGRNPIRSVTIGHPSDTMGTKRAIKMASNAISQGGLMPG